MSKTLDCSDLDNYMGKPMQPARTCEPVAVNDIRRWAQGMHYANLLHYDATYAAESRYGKIIAPQSFAVSTDDGHGAGPACVGRIPDSHLLFGGDEWWFTENRIQAGDLVRNERVPFDYAIKETGFAGPTCFQRGDNNYMNQNNELIAKQRSTAIRYSVDAVKPTATEGTGEPEWSDEEIARLEEQKMEYIQTIHDLGHSKRLWKDVEVGDALPTRIIGPHSIASFATEWRAYTFTVWGAMHRRTDLDFEALGYLPEMAGHENDPVMERINPELTDGAYYGPSRGHLFPRWAQYIGMPRAYGYGASMGAWVLDYLAAWAGEWGYVLHSKANYRGPALSGDITLMNATIIDKKVQEDGKHIVQVDFKMTNQNGDTLCTAKAELVLPHE